MAEKLNEILFYHLQDHPLERVLPSLLEKTIERGWRAVVKASSVERIEALDLMLWTYRDDSFLGHGVAGDKYSEHQPIILTTGDEVPNGAGILFLVDDAVVDRYEGFSRVVHLFDGHDPQTVAGARAAWAKAKKTECSCTYWQQDDNGRWQKKA